MPRLYEGNGTYRLTCDAGCGTYVLTQSDGYGNTRDDLDLSGRLVHETFPSRGDRGGNSGICRTCQRARRGQRRVAGPRVPSTHRIVSADQRRFGVELELIFPSRTTRESIQAALSAAGLTGWRAKYDGSLSSGGYEVVSPILTGEDGENQVRTACRVLRGLGATPNRSCGLHVHHECRDLTADGFKALTRGWARNQNLIDGLVSPSRRNGANHYCQPLSDSEVRRIEACSTVEQITREGQRISRYKTLNLAALGRYHTVEIRQHQGTCDAEKIISWVKFGQGIIGGAAATPNVSGRTFTRVRDLLGACGEHLNETAHTFLLGRAVEFGAVEV